MGANHADPDRVRRGWAPEAWRLRCALRAARERLNYATADARLIDGVERWVLHTASGKAVPGPWWALACALTTAMGRCLADVEARRTVAPWVAAGPAPAVGADAGAGWKPLDLGPKAG